MKKLRNFSRILWRRRWYALATSILICGGFWAYALWLPDIFMSTAMIQVGPALMPKDFVRHSDDSPSENQIDTVRQMVQSRSFIERLIQEFQLFGYGSNEKFPMNQAVQSVRNSIEVENISRNVFIISYTSTDPLLTQKFTNRIAEILIRNNDALRKKRAVEADQFLDEQLRQMEHNLKANEERITQFKTIHPNPYTPAQEQEMMSISRDQGILNQQYTTLRNMKFQAQMNAYLETNRNSDQYRIIDAANLPEMPVSPNRVLLILIGLGVGLVMGIGVALARESFASNSP